MIISSVPAGASAPTGMQPGLANSLSSGTQLPSSVNHSVAAITKDALKLLVQNLSQAVGQRDSLLTALAPDLRRAVEAALQTSALAAGMSDGLTGMVRAQRAVLGQLHRLSASFTAAEALQGEAEMLAAPLQRLFADLFPEMPFVSVQRYLQQLASPAAAPNREAAAAGTVWAQLADAMNALEAPAREMLQKLLENGAAQDQLESGQVMENPNTVLSPPIGALAQVLEVVQFARHSASELKDASAAVKQLTDILQQTGQENQNISAKTENTLAWSFPLLLGNHAEYPAYLHIYRQKQQEPGKPGNEQGETWLRLCLDTQSLGAVDLVFHLYLQDHLDVRVHMPAPEAAQRLASTTQEIRDGLAGSALQLTNLAVTAGHATESMPLRKGDHYE